MANCANKQDAKQQNGLPFDPEDTCSTIPGTVGTLLPGYRTHIPKVSPLQKHNVISFDQWMDKIESTCKEAILDYLPGGFEDHKKSLKTAKVLVLGSNRAPPELKHIHPLCGTSNSCRL
jgi:hypothetical protein